MQRPLICLRCKLRLIHTSLRSRQAQNCSFVSINQDASKLAAGQLQEDIIPPKEKREESEQSAPRRLRRTKRETADDSMKGVLEELFDANRHKTPSSTTSRYSRKPIESNPSAWKSETKERVNLADTKHRSNIHLQESLASATQYPSATTRRQPALSSLKQSLFTFEKRKPTTAMGAITVPNDETASAATNHGEPLLQIKTSASTEYGNEPFVERHQLAHAVNSSSNSGPQISLDSSGVIASGLEEANFDSQLNTIKVLAQGDFDKIPEALFACQNLKIPPRTKGLDTRLHLTIELIAKRILDYCAENKRLPNAHVNLPLLIRWYRKYQAVLPNWYMQLVSVYLQKFYDFMQDYYNHTYDKALVDRSEVMDSILFLLRSYFFSALHQSEYLRSGNSAKDGLPTVGDIDIQGDSISVVFEERLQHFCVNIPKTDIPQVASLVAATCTLIHAAIAKPMMSAQTTRDAELFTSKFHHMMLGADFDLQKYQEFWQWDTKNALPEQWTQFISSLEDKTSVSGPDVQRVPPMLTVESFSDGSSGTKAAPKLGGKPGVTKRNTASKTLSPVTQAFRQMAVVGDNRMTIKLWQEFQRELKDPSRQFDNLDIVFADFLWGFVNLRKLEPINEVWTIMVQQGVKPTVQHWNAVLELLRKNRELDKFERIWQNMLESGCVPNNQSWTTYIVALLEQKRWQATIQVIDQMGKSWQKVSDEVLLDAGSKQEISPSLPSIVPINAAITGLLRIGLWPTAQGVLQWAKDFPVSIDTATYNIFLLHACRRGDDAGAEAIIKDMDINNIKQDVVTRTILLDKEVRDPGSRVMDLDPVEQEHTVIEKLQKMLDQGHAPNAHTFSVVLHALLHVAGPNLPAADAVLRLMRKHKIKIPPHIYTIVFTYYFKSEVPDLNALNSLWETIEAEHSRIDHVLYDRMIEGYASIGEVGKMIHFFRKMTTAGKVPGWLALHRGLSSLVRQRRWDLCTDFVSDVTNDGGHLHLGKRGWKGEKEFWQLVHELREQNLIPKLPKSQKYGN